MLCRWRTRLMLVCLGFAATLPARAAVNLTVMGAFPKGSPQGDILYGYVEEYQRSHPGIQITQVPRTGSDQEAMEKIYTSIAAGVAPDIVFIPQTFLTDYVTKEVVAPVPASMQARVQGGYLPGALQLAKYRGVLYGFPTENQTQALAYNSVIFAEAGLPDEAPRTWSDLRTMARMLTTRTSDGQIVRAGYGILDYATPISAFMLSYSRAHGNTPISDDLQRIDFSMPQSVAAVRFLKQMYREDQTAVIGSGGFGKSTLAMFFAHGPWQANGYRRVGQEFYAGLRSALPPVGSTGRHATTFYGYLWAVTPYTKHLLEAYEFLFWLNTEVTEKRTTRMGDVLEALGSIPNTPMDARNQPSMKEPFMHGFLQAIMTSAAQPIPPIPAFLESFAELSTQVVRVLKGEVPEEEAMQRVDQVIQQKLDDYYAKAGRKPTGE